MPEIDQNELIMRIRWNENIHVDENNRRVDELMKLTDDKVTEHTAYVGMQDYILNGEVSCLQPKRNFILNQDTHRDTSIAGFVDEGSGRENILWL